MCPTQQKTNDLSLCIFISEYAHGTIYFAQVQRSLMIPYVKGNPLKFGSSNFSLPTMGTLIKCCRKTERWILKGLDRILELDLKILVVQKHMCAPQMQNAHIRITDSIEGSIYCFCNALKLKITWIEVKPLYMGLFCGLVL
jgi:hypothetical protein